MPETPKPAPELVLVDATTGERETISPDPGTLLFRIPAGAFYLPDGVPDGAVLQGATTLLPA